MIQFLRMGGCKPAEIQVDVYQRKRWRFGSICFEQAANKPPTCPAQAHIVGNPENIAQGKMQLMRTCWTGCSLSTKINMSVSNVHEFVQELGS